MSESLTVACIGLGVMGGPIARHVAAAGHTVRLFNRTPARAERWLADNPALAGRATNCASPAEAAQGADFILTCVGNDDDLRQVLAGPDGALTALKTGALVIDHTTVSATVSLELAELAERRGGGFVDAPVSGGQSGAENGTLSVMCGGSDADVTRARPLVDAYAARIVHIGPVGSGQRTKMVNQIAIAGVLAGLSEAVRFTQAAGLDPAKVLEAIGGGAAQSWQMVNRWETMIDGSFDFGFAIDWMRKDLGLTLDEGGRIGATLPLTALVDQWYAQVQADGGARQDTSALVRHLPEIAR